MALLKPLSSSGVGSYESQGSHHSWPEPRAGIPKSSCPHPPRLMNGPEDLHWGLSGESIVDSLACSCLRMGPLYSELWKRKKAPLPRLDLAELWRVER